MNKTERIGRSYIELAVAVAALLILALLAIPRYQNLKRDAYRAQISNDSSLVETYVVDYMFHNDKMPDKSTEISDQELALEVGSKKAYLKQNLLKPEDIKEIGGLKHLLDKEEVLKHINTKLKGDFVYTDKGVIYIEETKKMQNEDPITILPEGGVWEKYEVSPEGYDLTVLGFKEGFEGDTSHIRDMGDLEVDGFKVVKIGADAFKDHKFTGEFPRLNNLREVKSGAFIMSEFTGTFDLPSIEVIGSINEDKNSFDLYKGAFESSKFSGFNIPNIKIIGDRSFMALDQIKVFPDIPNIEKIGSFAFFMASYDGEMPKLDKLNYIGMGAFRSAKFSGVLNLPSVEIMGKIVYDKENSTRKWGAFEVADFTEAVIPNIRILGDGAFSENRTMRKLPHMPKIEEIGSYAFNFVKFQGEFPKFDKLTFVGIGAFKFSEFEGELNLPQARLIGKIEYSMSKFSTKQGTFENSNFNNIVIPKIEVIGDNAFRGSKSLIKVPNMNDIVDIGSHSFADVEFKGEFPSLPKLKFIGMGAFRHSKFNGVLDLPNVEIIGKSDFGGSPGRRKLGAFEFSNFKSIDMPKLIYLGDSSFLESKELVEFPNMPLIKTIGVNVFSARFKGEFPKYEHLNRIGEDAFVYPELIKIPENYYKGWNGSNKWEK